MIIMRKSVFIILLCYISALYAQDSHPFEAKIYNEEYQMYIKMNLYDKNVLVDQEESLIGEIPGYFWTKRDTRKWYILDADVTDEKTALLTFVNDFGSEDFTARLTYDDNGEYTLERLEGSKLKIVVQSKYVKIPNKVVFKKVD